MTFEALSPVVARGRRQVSRRSIPDSPDQRHRDAELILSVLQAAHAWERASARYLKVKPIRELIFWVWEDPRLPQPLLRSKYPLTVPWTPVAQALYPNGAGEVSLEHVTPAAVIVASLLDNPPPDPGALVEILQRIEYVVIAPEDNRRLKAAGVDSKLAPGSTDPWDRYRVAGLDPSTFAPITPEA